MTSAASAAPPAAPGRSARRGAPAARALLVGPAACRALGDGACGRVELSFPGGGGYLSLDAGRVLLAGPRAPAGPLSLLVAGLPAAGLRPGAPAVVARDRLEVGALQIALSGARRPPPPRPLALWEEWAAAPGQGWAAAPGQGWAAALAAALARIPSPPAELAPGLRALQLGDLPAAVAALAGRGDGLTPAGDDALAGAAAWHWNRGRPLALDGSACAPLGREYLRCAERGELPEPAQAVLAAICAGDAPAAARRAGRLRAWGSSSGAALLWGIAAVAGAERRAA